MNNLPSNDELLQTFLAGNDVPCPMCAYNLRGLTEVRCPECGEPLSISVRPASYRYGALITALVIPAMGLGFSLFILIWALATRNMGFDAAVIVLLLGSVTEAAIILVLVAVRRAFRRASLSVKGTVIMLATIVTVLIPLFFFAFAR